MKQKYLTHRKAFRVSDLENQALMIMCQREDRTQSLMLREILREAAIRRGIQPLCDAANFEEITNNESEIKYESS